MKYTAKDLTDLFEALDKLEENNHIAFSLLTKSRALADKFLAEGHWTHERFNEETMTLEKIEKELTSKFNILRKFKQKLEDMPAAQS